MTSRDIYTAIAATSVGGQIRRGHFVKDDVLPWP